MEIISLIYLLFGFGCGFFIGGGVKPRIIGAAPEPSDKEKDALKSLQKQLEELISYSGGTR
ncbi:MAG: hypothetical protein RR846_03650 [Oscillospiraceae bacterium]